MFAHSQYHHSPAQIAALEAGVTLAQTTYRTLLTQARQLHETLVASGTVNPDGSQVRNGANRDVEYQRDTLIASAIALKTAADLDFADLVNFELRFVGQRFVTEAEMQERYKHCLAMIPGLRARYGLAEAA